jgi:hypothetical protein
MNYFVVRMNLILQRLAQNVTTEKGSDMKEKMQPGNLAAFLSGLTR